MFTCEMIKLCLQPIDLAVYAVPDVDSMQCDPGLSRAMRNDRIGFSTFKADTILVLSSPTKPKVATLVRNMTAIPLHPSLERLLSSVPFLSHPLPVPRVLKSISLQEPRPPKYRAERTRRQRYPFRQAMRGRQRVLAVGTIWDPCSNV